jgi:hypothetical protein
MVLRPIRALVAIEIERAFLEHATRQYVLGFECHEIGLGKIFLGPEE